MFWASVAAYSRINDLLSRPDLTMKELLDDDDVLQKCREKDPRLINFLSRSDNLDYLLDLISRTPVSNTFDHNLYRYPSLACEILTNDINQILDAIIEPTPVHKSYSLFQGYQHDSDIHESTGIFSLSMIHDDDGDKNWERNRLSDTFDLNSKTNDMLVVDDNSQHVNSSMELCQISADNNIKNDDDDSTNSASTSMSIIDESSMMNSQEKLLSNSELDDMNVVCSSNITLSSITNVNDNETKMLTTKRTNKINSPLTRPRVDMLIQFFNSNQPVNPLSASFVSRLLIHLTLHRGSVIIPYLRSSQKFLDQIFSCLDSCAVADLIIQLAQQETKQQCVIFEWFKADRLVERLVEKFDPMYSFEMHESAAHCLIELITVLRNYLINNPSNITDGIILGSGIISDVDVSSTDMLANATTTNHGCFNTAQTTELPFNSPYTNLFDKDEETYKAAENLLNILESEETMSMLLNRILCSENVPSSIVVNCVNVFMAVMDKRKPESCFSVGENGETLGCESLFQGGLLRPIDACSGDNNGIDKNGNNPMISLQDNVIIDKDYDMNGDEGNGISSNVGDTSSVNDVIDDDNNNNTLTIDKLHILKASENLTKACLPRLSELHELLKRFHSQFYNCMPTTNGILNPPLGRCRLAIVQFITALTSLSISSTQLFKAIVDTGFVKTLMELFEQYPLNTFLHHCVVDILKSLFKHSRVITGSDINSCISGKSNKPSNNSAPEGIITEQNQNDKQPTESLSSVSLPSPSFNSSSSSSSSSPVTATSIIAAVDSSIDSCSAAVIDQYDVKRQCSEPCKPSDIGATTTCYDELSSIFVSLIKDYHIIDWCLRLSPLPARDERPNNRYSPNCLVRLSKTSPKPGYSGHLWQIANMIEAAINGPRGDFVKSIIQEINMKDSWSEFVQQDLSIINSIQVTEDLSEDSNMSQEENWMRLITQYNLTELSDIFNFATGGLSRSKAPFVLAPISSSNLMQNKLCDMNGRTILQSTDVDDDDDDHDNDDTDDRQQQQQQPKPEQSSFSLLSFQASSRIDSNTVSDRISYNLSDLWFDPDNESEDNQEQNMHEITSKPFKQIKDKQKEQRDVNDYDNDVDDDDDEDDETASKLNHHGSSSSNPISDDEDNDVMGTKATREDKDGGGDEEEQVAAAADDDDNDDDDDDDDEEDLQSPIQIKQQHSSKQTNNCSPCILINSMKEDEFDEFDILRKPIAEFKILEDVKLDSTNINPWDEGSLCTPTSEWANFNKETFSSSSQSDSNEEAAIKWANFEDVSSKSVNSEMIFQASMNGISKTETTLTTNTDVTTNNSNSSHDTPDNSSHVKCNTSSISSSPMNMNNVEGQQQQTKSNEPIPDKYIKSVVTEQATGLCYWEENCITSIKCDYLLI
ncbi:unnamed protein product [Heterobilharzia americana]|nr:unnamed protein product [Heterobilharzia americana]